MANTHMMHDGGGGSAAPKIEVSVDDITLIYQQIESILNEFESNVMPNVESLGNNDFYTSGKAQEAMEAFQDANEKVLEVFGHYNRAAILVIEVLEEMMGIDEQIALQIIEKLELV